jgi:hypothetical protein
MKHDMIFYVMGILLAVGVLAKMVSYFTARKLVRAASDIQKSNHRLMRLVKAKFEHATMVSDKVQNVEAFVNKYFYEYKVLGARLCGWQSFPFKMIGLIITFGLVGMAVSFSASGLGEQTFRYGAFAAIYAVVLVSIHILSDEKIKLDAAKNYMVEYLENVCVRRYEKANRMLQSSEDDAHSSESEMQSSENDVQLAEENAQSKEPEAEVTLPEPELQFAKEETTKSREDQEMRIRAILEEFLA